MKNFRTHVLNLTESTYYQLFFSKIKMNQLIINELTQLSQTEKENGNHFKARAYSKVAKNISNLKDDLRDVKQALKIEGVGDSIGAKIREIMEKGKLQRNEDDSKDEKQVAIKILTSVYGIGPVRALELYAVYHIKSLADLWKDKNNKLLNDSQKIGLKYHDDLQLFIPRSEIKEIIKYIKPFKERADPNLIIKACGSYRRGASESGDIDILVTSKNWTIGGTRDVKEGKPEGISEFISLLKQEDFLTDELAYGEKKYMGICKLKNHPHRRIDFRFVPYDQYYFCLIYNTGSAKFNITMRQEALKKGYTLNEYRIVKLDEREKTITVNSEKEIFDLLGMTYLKPRER
jgi:DNA polymerase/3'-5' exonuclease PolX